MMMQPGGVPPIAPGGPAAAPAAGTGPAGEAAASADKGMPLFIGNISEHVYDNTLQDVLGKCGKIDSWKRVAGSNGKLQTFGFCTYSSPEETLRALRLLYKLKLAGKELNVKVCAVS